MNKTEALELLIRIASQAPSHGLHPREVARADKALQIWRKTHQRMAANLNRCRETAAVRRENEHALNLRRAKFFYRGWKRLFDAWIMPDGDLSPVAMMRLRFVGGMLVSTEARVRSRIRTRSIYAVNRYLDASKPPHWKKA